MLMIEEMESVVAPINGLEVGSGLVVGLLIVAVFCS